LIKKMLLRILVAHEVRIRSGYIDFVDTPDIVFRCKSVEGGWLVESILELSYEG
jgi:hypothetical protein